MTGTIAKKVANYKQILDWYRLLEITECFDDHPVNRFEQSRQMAAIPQIDTRDSARSSGVLAYSDQADRQSPSRLNANPYLQQSAKNASTAEQLAHKATTLDDLEQVVNKFSGCRLKNTATKTVFGDGNPKSRLMLIGEAPGRDEDLQGKPFVGRSGKLLDKMMAAIMFDRNDYYIANIVPWRPPGNRTPTIEEVQICKPFIARQIQLVNPDILLLLGGAAAQHILNTAAGIMRLRGKWQIYNNEIKDIRVMATFHPAYLLRQPIQKALAWRDLLKVQEALANRQP